MCQSVEMMETYQRIDRRVNRWVAKTLWSSRSFLWELWCMCLKKKTSSTAPKSTLTQFIWRSQCCELQWYCVVSSSSVYCPPYEQNMCNSLFYTVEWNTPHFASPTPPSGPMERHHSSLTTSTTTLWCLWLLNFWKKCLHWLGRTAITYYCDLLSREDDVDVYEYTSSTLLLALLLGRPGIERDGDIPKPNSMTAN